MATEKITGGQYGQRLRVSGSAELVRLASAFNEMAAALQQKDHLVTRQVAALEQANRELSLAREEAIRTEKMASIGLLAAGMAHEIGTPLATIMGYAELSAGELPENAPIQDYSRRIMEDCSRIDRIVRGLLDYSRPREESGDSTDVREVVGATIDLMKQQGAFNQISLQCEFADTLSPVQCNRHQLQQVIVNLLLNGRDASASTGSLLVRCSREEALVRLDVIDHGTGIADDSLKHIFDPFYTTKPPGKGTGLGLSISARIVEGFGGRIAVASTVGEGSCFSIWIPLSQREHGVEHDAC
jgi:two-component system, NtrC family, sensor kinase